MMGSVAGSFSGFIVTPFDVLKTRLMTLDVKAEKISTIQLAKQIVSEDGIKGLYKGATIRMMYLCVGGFAFFGIYEKIKKEMTAKFDVDFGN